jgi:large subunit ribosomal protein L25
MDEILIDLEKREVVGKAVKHLRAEGLVPAVIHDHGKESIHVTGQYVPMVKAYRAAGKHHMVTLKADGKQYTAIIKDVDFEPKKHELRHVVFNAVKANQKITAEVPVHIQYAEGNDATPAERAGLVVLHQLEAVEIESIPKNLPDALYFDGEKLTVVGDHITVADLIIPAGVVVKTDANQQVAAVFEPSALQAANDAAGGDDTDADATEAETAEASAEGTTAPEAKPEKA